MVMEVMPLQLVHGSGRIAAKSYKIVMGKLRHMLGSPKSTLGKVGSPQQHLSEIARSVAGRGEGSYGGHNDNLKGGTSTGFSPSCLSVICRGAEKKSSLNITMRHASSLIFAGKPRFRHSWSTWAEGRPRRQGEWGSTLALERGGLRRQIRWFKDKFSMSPPCT